MPVGSGEIICVEFYNWWKICSIASPTFHQHMLPVMLD
jgi:hypothetical protein